MLSLALGGQVVLGSSAIQVIDELSFRRHWISPSFALMSCLLRCLLRLQLLLSLHLLFNELIVTSISLCAGISCLNLGFLLLFRLLLFLFSGLDGSLQGRHLALWWIVFLEVAPRALASKFDLALSLLSLLLLPLLLILFQLRLQCLINCRQLLNQILRLHVVL